MGTGDSTADYDALPYDSRAIPQAHVERLAVLGSLHGHAAPAVERCRVLELGAADGAHLLPMALAYPESHFVGVDVSPVQVARGRERVSDLGLGNVELLVADFTALSASLGAFDYILAHGVYSWVPEGVRDALLSVVGERLTERGLGYLSYKTYPGSLASDAARNLLLPWVRDIRDPRARAARARELARDFQELLEPRAPLSAVLKEELRTITERSDSAIIHDWLEATSDAVYFRDFAAALDAHGLAYVCEAIPGDDALDRAPPKARAWVKQRALDPISSQEALDFLLGRRIRHSIVRSRRGAEADGGAARGAAPVLDFYVGSSAQGTLKAGKLELLAPSGARVELTGPIGAAMQRVLDRFPEFLRARELVAAGPSGAPTQAFERELGAALRALYAAGALELRVEAPRCVRAPSERPRVSPLARLEGKGGAWVTNQHHQPVHVEDRTIRGLLALSDGTRSAPELASALGVPLETVKELLARLARFALLEA